MNRRRLLLSSCSMFPALLGASPPDVPADATQRRLERFLKGENTPLSEPGAPVPLPAAWSWESSGPIVDVGPGREAPDPHIAIKDPSIVFHGGRWHLFTTLRMKSGKVVMEYQNFETWAAANKAPRTLLTLHDDYFCAPQVFWFTPQQRWYLIYQCAFSDKKPRLWPCFSTTKDIADPASWTKPQVMIPHPPENQRWIDFWVICDDTKAHLFYTSDDGHFWRRYTKLADFPFGWSDTPQLCLHEDIFEASHTYRHGDRYLTIIEALGRGRRYYKAYEADKLDGEWSPLAATLAHPFAAKENVRQHPAWTTSVSHGELIRKGVDEKMELAPGPLRFLYQGVDDTGYKGGAYGQIPWRLGLMEQAI